MSTPIGFIRRGKRIRVGEVPKKRGTLLPIIVSGRIGYIPIKHLSFDSSRAIRSKEEIVLEEMDEDFISPIQLEIDYQAFYVKEVSDEMESAFLHRILFFAGDNPRSLFDYRIGLGFIHQEHKSFSQYAIPFVMRFIFRPIHNSDFSWNINTEVLYSPLSFQFDRGYRFEGQFFQAQLTTDLQVSLSTKWTFRFGGGLSSSTYILSEGKTGFNNTVSETLGYVGISYNYFPL